MVTSVILAKQISSFSDRFKFEDDSFDCDGEHSTGLRKSNQILKICLMRFRRRRDCLSRKCREAEEKRKKNTKKIKKLSPQSSSSSFFLVYSESHDVN